MTVASIVNKHICEGNGTTTEWPYTFDIINDVTPEIKLYVTNPAGVITLLTNNYSIDTEAKKVIYPIPDSGLSPLAKDYKLTILRYIEPKQEVDWTEQGSFSPEVLEKALDKITMLIQQAMEEQNRCVKYSVDQNPSTTDTETYLTIIQQAYVAAAAAQTAAEAAQASAAGAEATAAAMYGHWATATRPTSPTAGYTRGYNSDIDGEETFTVHGWLIKNGFWNTDTRPDGGSLAPGSEGFNTDLLSKERWDGLSWRPC